MTKHSNRLIHETSPYLLQHAHNPVDWYPWGEEALALARERNVPILVSIGYSACHWCHVMERESFENEETAAIMNKHFVNIKIDREERPDLDHIYMDAVQAMTGSGGWPLNVFLTPDARPFYGGTYFPPRPIAGRPSWNDLLIGVSEAFKSRHEEIDRQAEQLTAHLRQANAFGLQKAEPAQEFAPDDARLAYEAIMAQADRQCGGFGRAPKFPQTLVIRFLLHYYWYTKKEDALDQACLSLDKMIAGGLYDQVGGGFARYSTDTEWLAPHFEKMLYDNALLIYAISEAFQLTRNSRYESVLRETIDFVNRELRQPGGGFYSALDADSEGEEGKFYVWSLAEVESVLGKDAGRFAEYFDITEKGNWEGKNILRVSLPLTDFAAGRGLDPQELETQLESGKKRLLAAREQRVRPRLDDKCLLGWNAMMVTAYLKAGSALDDAAIRQQGLEVLDWLRANLAAGDSGYAHSWKGERSVAPAFLDDYAQLIEALILAQEVTADPAWLQEARQLAAYVVDGFSDEEGLFFYYTNTNQTDVIIRKKEIYDGATPSGNALMAINLYRLGVLFGLPAWIRRSEQMLGAIKPTVTRYPTSFGLWALLMQARGYGIAEIALIGENFDNLQREFLLTFTPLSVFQPAPRAHKGFPLLEGKPETARPLLYLCRNYSCQNPVTELDALIRQLEVV